MENTDTGEMVWLAMVVVAVDEATVGSRWRVGCCGYVNAEM